MVFVGARHEREGELRGRGSEILRVASWRRRPEDPNSALSWVVWGDRHLPQARLRLIGRLVLSAVAVGVAVGIAFGGEWTFLVAFLVWIGLALYARPGAREHANLPSLDGTSAYPVTVEIAQGWRQTGRDNGWVAFADGWLVYEGLRTEFAFRASDARSAETATGLLTFWTFDGRKVRLRALTDFMQTNRPAGRAQRRELSRAFHTWRRSPVPEGASVLPPSEVGLRVRGERVGGFALGGTFAALFGAATVLAKEAPLAMVAFVAASVCGALALSEWMGLRRALRAQGFGAPFSSPR